MEQRPTIVSGSSVKLTDLGMTETRLRDWLAEDPARLGLPGLARPSDEPAEGADGTTSLLLSDGRRWFTIVAQPGEIDATHGFRVLDHWARNRARYPGRTHVAVLVAESAGGLYEKALVALAEHLPLVVIELRTWRGVTEGLIIPAVALASRVVDLSSAAPRQPADGHSSVDGLTGSATSSQVGPAPVAASETAPAAASETAPAAASETAPAAASETAPAGDDAGTAPATDDDGTKVPDAIRAESTTPVAEDPVAEVPEAAATAASVAGPRSPSSSDTRAGQATPDGPADGRSPRAAPATAGYVGSTPAAARSSAPTPAAGPGNDPWRLSKRFSETMAAINADKASPEAIPSGK